MAERLTNWTGRQKLSAAHLNEAWDLLRKISNVVGYDVSQAREDAPRPFLPRVKLGLIVDGGPEDEEDYEDERYWVRECGIEEADTQDEPVVPVGLSPLTFTDLADESDATVPTIVTVTNLTEVAGHNHTLTVGSAVLFFELIDQTEPTPNIRRVMTLATHHPIPVKLTQVGGSNGSKTTAPTYTYDIFHLTATKAGAATAGAQLGTAQAPMIPRPKGNVVPATLGEAFPASDGGVVLWRAFEKSNMGGC